MLAKKTKANLTDKQLLRYNRHIVLPEIDIDGQTILVNSKVAIIGLGGLGCPVSTPGRVGPEACKTDLGTYEGVAPRPGSARCCCGSRFVCHDRSGS